MSRVLPCKELSASLPCFRRNSLLVSGISHLYDPRHACPASRSVNDFDPVGKDEAVSNREDEAVFLGVRGDVKLFRVRDE